MRWSVLNSDQILPIPHLAFSLHVKASFSISSDISRYWYWDIPTMRWPFFNPDQILPIPHLAFKALSSHVRASFAISSDILRYLRYFFYKRWSVLNPDQILPIPHLAFSLHVKASFSPQNISAASKRAPNDLWLEAWVFNISHHHSGAKKELNIMVLSLSGKVNYSLLVWLATFGSILLS